MPLTISLDDLLTLTINDPFTDARRFLYQNTSAGGWCAVIPEHIAAQVSVEDADETVALVRKYESPVGVIHALFTKFNFRESGESHRLAREAMVEAHDKLDATIEAHQAFAAQRIKCTAIIDYFVATASPNHKGVVTVFRPVLQRAAVDSSWNCIKLVEILDLLGTSISLDLIPAHIREEYSTQTILDKYINESSKPVRSDIQSDVGSGPVETSRRSDEVAS